MKKNTILIFCLLLMIGCKNGANKRQGELLDVESSKLLKTGTMILYQGNPFTGISFEETDGQITMKTQYKEGKKDGIE